MNVLGHLLGLVFGHLFILMGIVFVMLTAVGARMEKSVKRWLVAAGVALFAVMLPLFFFLVSALLVPDSKKTAWHGWFDCFYLGKLALTPLVLWATGALFLLENGWVEKPYRVIRFGLLNGAVVATGCFLFGWLVNDREPFVILLLSVPLYTAIWHGIRGVQCMNKSGGNYRSALVAVCSSIPFWMAGIVWARRIYTSLPENPPDC